MMELTIVAPDRVFYRGNVLQVQVCTPEGTLGILPEHVSLVTLLIPGRIIIYEEHQIREAALGKGFCRITGSRVTLFADTARWEQASGPHAASDA